MYHSPAISVSALNRIGSLRTGLGDGWVAIPGCNSGTGGHRACAAGNHQNGPDQHAARLHVRIDRAQSIQGNTVKACNARRGFSWGDGVFPQGGALPGRDSGEAGEYLGAKLLPPDGEAGGEAPRSRLECRPHVEADPSPCIVRVRNSPRRSFAPTVLCRPNIERLRSDEGVAVCGGVTNILRFI